MAALKRIFITEKLQSPAGRIILVALSALIAAGIGYAGLIFGILVLVAAVGLPMIYAIVKYPKFGIIVMFVFANLLAYLTRMNLFSPLGTLMDALQGLLVFSIIIRQKN